MIVKINKDTEKKNHSFFPLTRAEHKKYCSNANAQECQDVNKKTRIGNKRAANLSKVRTHNNVDGK